MQIILMPARGHKIMKGRKIQYEDDLVIVYDDKGNVAYKGMEDYDPNKDLDWKWDDKRGGYVYKGWFKVCVG